MCMQSMHTFTAHQFKVNLLMMAIEIMLSSHHVWQY